MNARFLVGAALTGLLASSNLLADDYCGDPVADWQPREALRQQLERYGWTVRRIKVDDGCYEVRGTDRAGNRVDATFSPASLHIRRLTIDFRQGGDASDYLGQGQ